MIGMCCGIIFAKQSSRIFSRCYFTPRICPNKNVTFFLYTRETQNNPVQLNVNKPKTITEAKYAKGRPLIIIIHGYTGDKDYAPNEQIRPAYFKKDNFNIISVDYSTLALHPCYFHAVSNLPTVANCTAQLLDFFVDNKLFSLDDIHVIGFSLGAQTSGMVANYLKNDRKLKRITGLDPAKPLFIRVDNKWRLDSSDAEFVEQV